MRELGPISPAPPAFPLATAALAPLRAEAERAGSGDFSPLWSGQNASRMQGDAGRASSRATSPPGSFDSVFSNPSSGKQYSQRSPGSAEATTGCPLVCACLVAWRLGELSQQSVHAAFLARPQVDPLRSGS